MANPLYPGSAEGIINPLKWFTNPLPGGLRLSPKNSQSMDFEKVDICLTFVENPFYNKKTRFALVAQTGLVRGVTIGLTQPL